jgi:hypothetical protein
VRTRLILVLALLSSLLFAASASASGRDANHDRIPDRWEKHHGLSLKVKQAKRDQDKDGFRNRAEWRAKTDPRDADTDGDGIKDSDENAGTVTAYENGVLTITLFDGGTLTGTVTDETELKCETPAAPATTKGDDDDDDGDDDGDRHHHGDRGHGDDDHGDCDSRQCAADALKVGANVKEAELKVTSQGRVWDEIELR